MAAALAVWASPAFAQQADRCESRWSAAQDLLSFDGRPTYIESPTLARSYGGLMLVGTPSFFWATRDAFDPAPGPLASDTAEYVARLRDNHFYVGMTLDSALRASGVRFPSPLRGPVARTRIAQDASGRIHLYWITRPEDSLTLWHSRREGAHWSLPEVLLTENAMNWQWSDVRSSADTAMHIVVPVYRTRLGGDVGQGGGGIAYLRQTAEGTRAVISFHAGLPRYASVLPHGPDSVLIAYTGMDTTGIRGDTRLLLVRAATRDTVLPAARPLQSSGSRATVWPTLFRDSSAANGPRVAILWGSSLPDSTAADSIHVMVSRDGTSWLPPVSAALPRPARHFSIVPSATGGLHGVSHSGHAGEAAVHFHWRNGAWQSVEVLPFPGIASAPSLMRVHPDSLLLMWGERRPYPMAPPEAPAAPLSRYAWLVTSCRRASP